MSERENKIKRQDDDYILINKFLGNDTNAFERLVIKYKDMIFNLCFRILGDYEEANDCGQEIFIKVFKNLKNFKFEASFSTWLYRIAVNTCRNELSSLRFRMKKKTKSLDDPGNNSEAQDDLYSKKGDNSFNPAYIYEKKEKEKIIQNAINSLKGKEKILVVLRDIEGKSYEEITLITGIKTGTVKSKLARARQELRNKLRGVI